MNEKSNIPYEEQEPGWAVLTETGVVVTNRDTGAYIETVSDGDIVDMLQQVKALWDSGDTKGFQNFCRTRERDKYILTREEKWNKA